MSKYGLTPEGPNIKRLDVILSDMHRKLSERWGVNTQQNPSSFLNHALTNISDAIAEVWEFAESVYYAKYPSTAEGANLDNAAQYGGSTREPASKSYYPIHCTGKDGTKLAAGTMISSNTNPATLLTISDDREITRAAFSRVEIKVASLLAGDTYSVGINGMVYSYKLDGEATALNVLNGLVGAIRTEEFVVAVNEKQQTLSIECVDNTITNVLILTENLTTETVTSIITFGTVENGNIKLPDGVITNIVKADAGLLQVENKNGYIAGRLTETDSEFRQSYTDKIFNRSQTMLESIRSAILNNVQGVNSVAPYENETDEVDEWGRPPHSVEIVVDGGDSHEIAQQIFAKKSAGINTFGDTSVVIQGDYDEDFTIYFSRPSSVYVWFSLNIMHDQDELPADYESILKSVILEKMSVVSAGTDIVPQKYMSEFYEACPGINYIDIRLFSTDDPAKVPTDAEYDAFMQSIGVRQRAYTSENMIRVRFYE